MTGEAAWELPAAMIGGALADALLGDPARYHPVAGLGRVAGQAERLFWRPSRRAGVTYCASLTGGCTMAAAVVDGRLASLPALRGLWRAALIWTVLGGRSLRREAMLLGAALERGEIDEARRRAPALVGRDPSGLDAPELARATVESVAENTADAVVASLLWCALAGVSGAAAHRAANTLDAMVGHRSERYAEFGWASARLDDVVNFLPARLTALLTALAAPVAGGSPLEAARTAVRDGRKHPSPNAGPVEAAFAGALGVQLGGLNRYGDQVEQRPRLGDGVAVTVTDIRRAVALSRAVEHGALLACAGLAWVVRR